MQHNGHQQRPMSVIYVYGKRHQHAHGYVFKHQIGPIEIKVTGVIDVTGVIAVAGVIAGKLPQSHVDRTPIINTCCDYTCTSYKSVYSVRVCQYTSACVE